MLKAMSIGIRFVKVIFWRIFIVGLQFLAVYKQLVLYFVESR